MECDSYFDFEVGGGTPTSEKRLNENNFYLATTYKFTQPEFKS